VLIPVRRAALLKPDCVEKELRAVLIEEMVEPIEVESVMAVVEMPVITSTKFESVATDKFEMATRRLFCERA